MTHYLLDFGKKPVSVIGTIDDAREQAIYYHNQSQKKTPVMIIMRPANSNSFRNIGCVQSYANPLTMQIGYYYTQFMNGKSQDKYYPLNRNGTIDTKMSPDMKRLLSRFW